MKELDRRRFLTASGAGLTALLAGCQGSDDSTDSSTTTAATTRPSTDATVRETDATTDETTQASADPEELKQRAREFVGLVADGSYEAAHDQFTQSAAAEITVDQLQQVWSGLESQNGEFQTLSELEAGERSGYDSVTAVANFERGRRRVILAFEQDAIAGFQIRRVTEDWSPPEYADESSVTEQEVSLQATDGCTLGGTVTLPEGVEQAPGVVLVHGQGPQDEDGTIGPNKPYKDLAWGLASRGVAVLRYDKRTAACDVDLAEITIDEAVTEDALAAVDALREVEMVADDDVVVAGHSIGATLAPRIADRDGNLAGVVMLAPLARSAGDAILDQNEYLANRDGTVTDAEQERLDEADRIVEKIRSLDFPDDETVYIGGDEYWRTLREYDHLNVAQSVEVPQLLLFGERDYQVTVEDDLPLWRDALDEKESVSFDQYPDLNHLFMPGSGKPSQQEYYAQNHVAEQVVTDVAGFAADATGVDGGD